MINTDIQFLRGFAVIAVLLYHFGLVSGGFIGVDIFFVISGYLITGIIVKDYQNQNFNYFRYLHRRCKRLLPIYITSLIFTTLLFLYFGWPVEINSFTESLLPSLLFYSNYWFLDNVSYWDSGVLLSPLLHTWSLSVEIQFYLIVPIIIIVAVKYTSSRYIFYAILVLASLFFVGCLFTFQESPSFAFYSIHTRLWEFLIGSSLVFVNYKYCKLVFQYKLNLICCLALVCLPFWYSESTKHPYIPTSVIIFVASLIILGSRHKNILFLRNRIFLLAGDLSYGAYLFHYPIAVFLIRDFGFSPELAAFGTILSFLIAFIGKKLVEDPVRYSQVASWKSYKMMLISSFFLCAFASLGVSKVFDIVGSNVSTVEYYKTEQGRKASINYEVSAYNADARGREFVEDKRPKVLIIGDSYSMDVYNIFNEAGLFDNVQVSAYFLMMGCQNVLSGTDLKGKILPRNIKDCENILRVGDDELDKFIKQADLTLLATRWTEFTTLHIERLVDYISTLGKNSMVIGRKEFLFPDFEYEQIDRQNFS
ncbi:MAG: acyltransferase family protein, partial [Paracoccaceae bacterium]